MDRRTQQRPWRRPTPAAAAGTAAGKQQQRGRGSGQEKNRRLQHRQRQSGSGSAAGRTWPARTAGRRGRRHCPPPTRYLHLHPVWLPTRRPHRGRDTVVSRGGVWVAQSDMVRAGGVGCLHPPRRDSDGRLGGGGGLPRAGRGVTDSGSPRGGAAAAAEASVATVEWRRAGSSAAAADERAPAARGGVGGVAGGGGVLLGGSARSPPVGPPVDARTAAATCQGCRGAAHRGDVQTAAAALGGGGTAAVAAGAPAAGGRPAATGGVAAASCGGVGNGVSGGGVALGTRVRSLSGGHVTTVSGKRCGNCCRQRRGGHAGWLGGGGGGVGGGGGRWGRAAERGWATPPRRPPRCRQALRHLPRACGDATAATGRVAPTAATVGGAAGVTPGG